MYLSVSDRTYEDTPSPSPPFRILGDSESRLSRNDTELVLQVSLPVSFSTILHFILLSKKKKKLIKDKKISGGAGMLESVEVERGFRRDIQ
jgi:hypothetical protein